MSDVISVADVGHVRTITMNRPEKKNALSEELAWGVITSIREAAEEDNVWVIAITGTGDAFCSGLDLTGSGESATPMTPQSAQLDDLGWVSRLFYTLREECDKPIVAGINGVAVGAGLSLALAADIRLIQPSARLMAGYPRIGASPDGGMTMTLSQALGYEGAMRFLVENRTVMGEEAVAIGMAGELVEEGQMESRLAEYCAFLAERSAITLRLTKRGLRRATRIVDPEEQLRYEVANIGIAFRSEDSQEARKAFFEKREPVFKGK